MRVRTSRAPTPTCTYSAADTAASAARDCARRAPAMASVDYANHMMWMHHAEGSLAGRVIADYRVWMIKPPTERSRLVDSEAEYQFAEDYLAKHPWFGGAEFSAADIMMVFPLNFGMALNVVDKTQFPNINAWKKAPPRNRAPLAS